MAGETQITVVGNLTADPELRFTPSGAAVANFTVASTPRVFDKATNEWTDGETAFWPCSIWRDAAEHVAESLVKGDRVVALGRVKTESWADRETGDKRTRLTIEVDEVGPSLKFRIVRHGERVQRSSGSDSNDPWARSGSNANDPWAHSDPVGASDQPPF
jgi:single-strand DNA-binding protein